VWERTVDGRVLSFRLAGINNQNFIMQDRETGSWWQQVSGAAILGPLKGKRLTRVFHDELTFRTWTKETPGGRVLVPAADTAWKRFSANWEDSTALRPVRVHAPLDRRLAPRAIVVGIELAGAAKAYPKDRVLAQAPLHDRVGGRPVVLLVGPDGKSVRGFEARLDDRELELVKPTEGPAGEVVDLHRQPLELPGRGHQRTAHRPPPDAGVCAQGLLVRLDDVSSADRRVFAREALIPNQ